MVTVFLVVVFLVGILLFGDLATLGGETCFFVAGAFVPPETPDATVTAFLSAVTVFFVEGTSTAIGGIVPFVVFRTSTNGNILKLTFLNGRMPAESSTVKLRVPPDPPKVTALGLHPSITCHVPQIGVTCHRHISNFSREICTKLIRQSIFLHAHCAVIPDWKTMVGSGSTRTGTGGAIAAGGL